MVEPVPTGTPITDPKLIRMARTCPIGLVRCFFGEMVDSTDNCKASILYEHKNAKEMIAQALPWYYFEYRGVFDDEFSLYTGSEYYIQLFLVLSMEISPETHDVSVGWEDVSPFPHMPQWIGATPVAIIKRKEVMKW